MEFARIADKKRVDFITATIISSVPDKALILDIGCGNGLITRAVGQLGFNVTGIDVSAATIAIARAHNSLPNVHFNVVAAGELMPEPGRYHAIICSEVLEHLAQPEELLRIIHQSLHDDGVLIVTVPNGRGPRELFVTRPIQWLRKSDGIAWKLISRFKGMMGYRGTTVQSSAEDLVHIQFFTRKSLSELAGSTHFSIGQLIGSGFIEQVFPFSLLTRRSITLQKLDWTMASRLPVVFTSGFMSVWRKKI